MTSSVMKLERLTKRRGDFTLGPIDLSIEPGIVVAIVGPNGSGKSTLFQVVMNLLKPDEGVVHLWGHQHTGNEPILKAQIGYVGQSYEPFEHLTIDAIASLISHWYPTWKDETYVQLLQRYELSGQMRLAKCSTGMKKKAEFVLALARHPKLLLLDEYSAGVDMLSQRKMKEDLNRFMENGDNSIVMATHVVDEVAFLSDDICIMRNGHVVESFNKDDVREQWARLWVSEVNAELQKHTHIRHVDSDARQIITDQLPIIEKQLEAWNIEITHMQRLDLDEVLGYILIK